MARYSRPEMTGWWVCCQEDCHREVDSSFFGTTCPDCGHEKCDDCGELGNSTASVFNPTYAVHPADSQQPPAMLYTHQHEYHHGHQHASQDVYHHDSFNGHHISHGRLKGWWQCCQCQSPVNPSLNGWECPVDNHQYCGGIEGYCYIYS